MCCISAATRNPSTAVVKIKYRYDIEDTAEYSIQTSEQLLCLSGPQRHTLHPSAKRLLVQCIEASLLHMCHLPDPSKVQRALQQTVC